MNYICFKCIASSWLPHRKLQTFVMEDTQKIELPNFIGKTSKDSFDMRDAIISIYSEYF